MRNRVSRRRAGFSLIELLIVIAIILVIAAIALPKLDKTQMNGREMAAIRQIQTIHTAQTQYYSQFGRFATSLAELGPPASGQAGPTGADLIPKALAEGTNSGYQFTVQGGPNGYAINANPVAFNSTGRRTFYSDQSMEIKQNWGAQPATAQNDALK